MANQPKNIFTIRSTLKNYRGPRVYRTLEIDGSTSLHKLAYEILKSFGFALDHCYGFFSNLTSKERSDEVYDHFLDDPEFERDRNLFCSIYKGTVNVPLREAFEPKKRMLFYFDYGDEWEFTVICQKVQPAIAGVVYPRVIKESGVAPKQYPNSDEEDEIMRRRGLM